MTSSDEITTLEEESPPDSKCQPEINPPSSADLRCQSVQMTGLQQVLQETTRLATGYLNKARWLSLPFSKIGKVLDNRHTSTVSVSIFFLDDTHSQEAEAAASLQSQR